MLAVLTGAMVTAGLVLASLAGYVWRRRGSASGLSLAVLLAAVAWWAAAYAVELHTEDLTARLRWGDLKYVGVCVLPPAWLTFVLQYTGRDRLVTPRLLVLLAVEPALVWTLLAVPATHDLLRYFPDSAAGDEIPVVATGPLFWVHLVYANAMVLVATGVFVASMSRLARVYRTSAVVLVGAALLPWVANLLHNFGVGVFARVDLTPFAFVVTGGVLVWGLYRERLINLATVAWGVVVRTMPDAVILLDAFGRVLDANPATSRLLGQERAHLVGLRLDDVMVDQPRMHGVVEGDLRGGREVTLQVDGHVRHFEVNRQFLADAAGPSGELVLLRDITARKEDEARLRGLLEERTRIASALQVSLLPPVLPDIPECVLAAAYEPAGSGHEIGGDFYDVFPVGAGRWGIALGDVSGKGAEAAAVTGLIRYTLRTLAMERVAPSKVLARLNAVLMRDAGADERFCTAAFAVIEPLPAGLRLRLCLGGHHPPLLRRADGRVEQVGALGTGLGLVAEPELHDVHVDLRAGDVLCLFTDGLVEARRGPHLFGSEGATEQLRAMVDPTPQQVVDRLVGAAHDFRQGQLTDDLALLAVTPRSPATS